MFYVFHVVLKFLLHNAKFNLALIQPPFKALKIFAQRARKSCAFLLDIAYFHEVGTHGNSL